MLLCYFYEQNLAQAPCLVSFQETAEAIVVDATSRAASGLR
jgi:hypothetical protein